MKSTTLTLSFVILFESSSTNMVEDLGAFVTCNVQHHVNVQALNMGSEKIALELQKELSSSHLIYVSQNAHSPFNILVFSNASGIDDAIQATLQRSKDRPVKSYLLVLTWDLSSEHWQRLKEKVSSKNQNVFLYIANGATKLKWHLLFAIKDQSQAVINQLKLEGKIFCHYVRKKQQFEL